MEALQGMVSKVRYIKTGVKLQLLLCQQLGLTAQEGHGARVFKRVHLLLHC